MSTQHQLATVEAPSPLDSFKGWLVWRYEPNLTDPIKGKPRKIPYYINGDKRHGVNGSDDDRAHLTDFTSAKQFAISNNYTGVGLALMPEFGITALDFDNVVDDLTGDITNEVMACIDGTYAEFSPSGLGIRAFVLGDLGNHKSVTSTSQFGFELFNSKGFVTFTGNTINKHDIKAPNPAAVSLIDTRWPKARGLIEFKPLEFDQVKMQIDELSSLLGYMEPDCGYHEWVSTGMAIHFETSGSEEGFQLWDSWSSNCSSKYASVDANRAKWQSFNVGTTTPLITGRSLLKSARDHGFTEAELLIDFAPLTDENKPDVMHHITPKTHFNITSAEEFLAQAKPVTWLIKSFLPKATLGVLYGESGSGKSFLALDVCAALGRGVQWNNLRSPEGNRRILYVVAEGAGGFASRLKAYCLQQGTDVGKLNIDLIHGVVPNLTDAKDVKKLIEEIRQLQANYDLIVMDTFAQMTPGSNENSGEDMGKALSYCKQISLYTNAMVLLVHHSGKDASKGIRGWSGVNAAADVVLEVSRDELNNRKIRVAKQKDGTDGVEFGFRLKDVIVGYDEDGDSNTSCVVEYCDVFKKLPKLGANQQTVVEVINELKLHNLVTKDHLLSLVLEAREPPEGVLPKTFKSNIKQAIDKMIGKVLIENDGKEVKLMENWKE